MAYDPAKSLPVFDANDPCLGATSGSWDHGCCCPISCVPLENLPHHLFKERIVFHLLSNNRFTKLRDHNSTRVEKHDRKS